MVRGAKLRPAAARQNIVRVVLRDRSATSASASPARPRAPYIPIFVGVFLLILFDNWIGLVPPVGKVELLRAPVERREHHARAGPRRAS